VASELRRFKFQIPFESSVLLLHPHLDIPRQKEATVRGTMSTDTAGKEGHQKQHHHHHPNLEDEAEEGGLFRKILASTEKAMAMALAASSSSSSPRCGDKTIVGGVVGGNNSLNRRLSRHDDPRTDSKRRRVRTLWRRNHLEEGEDEEAYGRGLSDDDEVIRDGYRRRLATYGPHNFFGKPPSLSPVVCARFGCVPVLVCVMLRFLPTHPSRSCLRAGQ
jgi:hypothetical protein